MGASDTRYTFLGLYLFCSSLRLPVLLLPYLLFIYFFVRTFWYSSFYFYHIFFTIPILYFSPLYFLNHFLDSLFSRTLFLASFVVFPSFFLIFFFILSLPFGPFSPPCPCVSLPCHLLNCTWEAPSYAFVLEELMYSMGGDFMWETNTWTWERVKEKGKNVKQDEKNRKKE